MRQTCILLPDSDLVYVFFFFFSSREDNEHCPKHCPKLVLQGKHRTLRATHLAFNEESNEMTLPLTGYIQLRLLTLHRR